MFCRRAVFRLRRLRSVAAAEWILLPPKWGSNLWLVTRYRLSPSGMFTKLLPVVSNLMRLINHSISLNASCAMMASDALTFS